jgi:hypothetical protein
VHLRPGASVGQNASLAGDRVTTEGTIQRDLKIGAATAEIGGDVGGTVEAHAERVSVLPGAVIRGDLIVDGREPPDISPQARVFGQVRHEPSARDGSAWLAWPMLWLYSFAALLLLGLAAVAFSPSWAAHVASTLRTRAGRSVLTGLLWLIVTPVVVGLLLITIVGIPLALVLLAFYGVVLLLSAVFVAYRVGNWVFERGREPSTASPWLQMAIGVLIVSLGMSLPVIGWVIVLAVMLFGAGAIVLERRSIRTPAVAQP